MITALVLALVLGFSSGLRTFTAPAAVMLVRGGIWGIILTILAIVEYFLDLSPRMGPRTAPPSLIVRSISGAFVGWSISTMHGGPAVAGAILGIIGALIGAFVGLPARLATIKRIGAIPAGIAEDIVAIAIAAIVVTR